MHKSIEFQLTQYEIPQLSSCHGINLDNLTVYYAMIVYQICGDRVKSPWFLGINGNEYIAVIKIIALVQNFL